MADELASEKVILSAPMSFSGSAARIWKLTASENIVVRWLLLIPLALGLVLFVWFIVLCWYFVFGLWLVPWRLFRRSHRKEKKRELQHREILEQLQKR